MTRVILLNSPKNAGKTVARDAVMDSLPLLTEALSFKDHLHELVQKFYNISSDKYWDIYTNRNLKETPLDEFRVSEYSYKELCEYLNTEENYTGRRRLDGKCNLSIRESMIHTSELIAKRLFGQDYFGVIAASKMNRNITYIEDSAAFDSEIPPVIERVGQDNILLIRIKGRGDFSGDSRRFISDGVVKNTVDIWNDGTEREYLQQIIPLMTRFVMSRF